MKIAIKNIFTISIIAVFLLSTVKMHSFVDNSSGDCQADTTHLAVVEFHVVGMDSASVGFVQDVLDTTCGVSFNFACWNDTAVFVEYDSLLTNRLSLQDVITSLGFEASVKDMY
jgi:hypothetical protein